MKALVNLMGSYETGDAIADATVAYHDALESRHSVDLVEVPVVGGVDGVRRATIAVGWLTGLKAIPSARAGPDLCDDATVQTLAVRTLRIRRLRPRAW